jgi:hypothetical protein
MASPNLESKFITSFTVVMVACRHTPTNLLRDRLSFYFIHPIQGKNFFQTFLWGDRPMRNERHRQEKIRQQPDANRLVLRSEATSQSGMRSAYKACGDPVIRLPIAFSAFSTTCGLIIRYSCVIARLIGQMGALVNGYVFLMRTAWRRPVLGNGPMIGLA